MWQIEIDKGNVECSAFEQGEGGETVLCPKNVHRNGLHDGSRKLDEDGIVVDDQDRPERCFLRHQHLYRTNRIGWPAPLMPSGTGTSVIP